MDDVAEEKLVVLSITSDVMRQLQLLELTLWQFKALGLKKGWSDEQAFKKVSNWDDMTFGQMVDSVLTAKTELEWPEDLVAALKKSVDVRNYLACRFLRDFIAPKTAGNLEKASDQLAVWAVDIDAIEAQLEERLAALGFKDPWDDLDTETKAEIEAMQPKDWQPWL